MEKGKVTYIPEPEVIAPDLPALEGKAYRNRITGTVIRGALYLGKIFYKNGEKLEIPIQEKPEDYEVVDEPEM